MNENNGAVDTSNNQEGADTSVGAEETTQETHEEVDWKSKAEKAEELANNYKVRAEKAEKLAKQTKPSGEEVAPKNTDLSTNDVLAIVKAGVSEEDIDEVKDYASLKKISIKDALKTPFVKQLLDDKAEQRKTAEAAHTGTARRATAAVSDEDILANAENGKLPDDVEALVQARINSLKKRK